MKSNLQELDIQLNGRSSSHILGVVRRWKNAHSFTLIEILVVVAIIAILAALLFRYWDRQGKKAE